MKQSIIILILTILLIGVCIVSIKQCNDNKDLKFKISSQDSLIQLDSFRYSQVAYEYSSLEQAKNDLELRNKELSKIIDNNKEEIRYYTNLVLRVRDKYITRVDTVRFTVIDSVLQVPLGQDTIHFEGENSLVRVDGETYLYPTKGYWMNLQGKPFDLDVVVTEDDNDIFTGYVDTKNSDLELIKMNVKVLRKPETFWTDAFLLSGLNFTTKNTFVNLGFGKGQFGVNLIGGYDYQDYTIDKNNLFYGGGLIFKIK